MVWTGTGGSGVVRWRIRGTSTANSDALDSSWGTANAVDDTFISANDNHATGPTSAMTIGGTPALGDLIVLEFYRDAVSVSDTYTQDARLLNVTMQYKTLNTSPAAW